MAGMDIDLKATSIESHQGRVVSIQFVGASLRTPEVLIMNILSL